MNYQVFASVVGAGLGMLLAVSQSFAGPIEDRQQVMKNNGAAIKVLAQMASGDMAFDAATSKKNAETLVSDFTKLKDLFPEGSDKGPPDTWAKPEIWTDRAGFEAARTKALEASQAATLVTEQGQLDDAVTAIGNACKGCHEKYRTPKS